MDGGREVRAAPGPRPHHPGQPAGDRALRSEVNAARLIYIRFLFSSLAASSFKGGDKMRAAIFSKDPGRIEAERELYRLPEALHTLSCGGTELSLIVGFFFTLSSCTVVVRG